MDGEENGWRQGTLSELVTLNAAGWDPRSGETIKYLDISSIPRTGAVGEFREIDAASAPSRARRRAKTGDTLVSTVRPYLRAFALLREAPPDLVASTGFAVLTPRAASDAEFVFQSVLQDKFVSFLEPRMTGTGYPAVRGEDVIAYPIDIPPPDERARIGFVLRAIDEAIEKTEAVIAATEELRKALLQELLTRGVPGWHTEWKQVPGIGTIPACWEVVRLGEVAEVQTGRQVGKPPSRGAAVTVPYLSVANVKDGYLHLEAVKTMAVGAEEVERFRLKAGDVLFNEGGDADKVGRGCVWTGEVDPCLHQNHVFAVRPRASRLTPWFLTTYASSRAGKNYFLGCAKQTTNLASINSTQLKLFPVPLPDAREQAGIESYIGSIDQRRARDVSMLGALKRAKDVCAEALLSGRLRVPVGEGSDG